ncbi:MAG: hypothetical protein HQL37_07405 [Alphaproteobacteria bacterium]|nr:hypothetical protein [Alphaproteobacteria bacterium]
MAMATTLKELQIGIKTMSFMFNPPSERTEVAILYDPQIVESLADSRNIQNWVGKEAVLPNIELVPVPLDVGRLDNAAAFRVVIVTSGLEHHFDNILNYTRRNASLSITSDVNCVRDAKCVVGINATPTLNVFINQTAANACHIIFLSGFRMMVKEF